MASSEREGARIRLLCFAHAGGTARLFTPWEALLPASIALHAIELPGHGVRGDEAPLGSMPALLDRLLPEALALVDRPFAMFGHSTGAKVAFELSRALAARGAPPIHLFVAACPWLRFPPWGKGLHARPRGELVAALRRLGGTPEHVLRDDALLDFLLPMLRADFELANEYEVLPGPALACPLTAFAGARDEFIAVDDVAGWRRHTTGPFALEQLDAAHYFVKERAGEIVGTMVRALAAERIGR